MIRLLLIVFLSLINFFNQAAHANEEFVTGKFVVSFIPKNSQQLWITRALEKNVYNDLAGYERFIAIEKLSHEKKQCVNRDIDCLINLYKPLGVDAIMLGIVDKYYIDYQVYDVKIGSLVKTGNIEIGNSVTLLDLRMGAFNAFKSFLGKGGILDQRTFQFHQISPNQSPFQNDKNTLQTYQIVVFIMISSIPLLLSFFGNIPGHIDYLPFVIKKTLPFLLLAVSFLLILFSQFFAFLHISFVDHVSVERFSWLFSWVGGLCWGFFLLLHLKVLLPKIQGIEKIKQEHMFDFIQAYSIIFLMKIFLLAFVYYGLYAFLSRYFFSKDLDSSLFNMFLFPITALLVCYWINLFVDVFSMHLDMRYQIKDKNLQKKWHYLTKKYFMHNLKRHGSILKYQLVDKTQFIATEAQGIACYGGFLSYPRIAINVSLLESAIAKTYEDIDKILNLKTTEKPEVHILPEFVQYSFYPSLFKASDKKKHRFFQQLSKDIQRHPNDKTPHQLIINDINQGVILPDFSQIEDLPALMFDNIDDMSIVEALLIEDTSLKAALIKEEIDDSSEKDKDFLFGILLQKFGIISRREYFFSTFSLFLRRKQSTTRKPRLIFLKYFMSVSDSFVAVNFGLSQLLQYLYIQATDSKNYMTTRAASGDLLRCQNKILNTIKNHKPEKKKRFYHFDDFDRMVWLSKFSDTPIIKTKNSAIKKTKKWGFTLILSSFLFYLTIESYQYNNIYHERLDSKKQKIQETLINLENLENEAQ